MSSKKQKTRFYSILSEEQLENLNNYKHKAEKTTFELFMCNGPSLWLEHTLFPDSWTPNCLTLIG
jgi:hypothetical protein